MLLYNEKLKLLLYFAKLKFSNLLLPVSTHKKFASAHPYDKIIHSTTYYKHQFRNYFLHSIIAFFYLSPLLAILLLPIFAPKWVDGNIARNIVKMVKDTVLHQSTTEVTKMMKSHLMQMQLINAQENWAHPRLKSIEYFLFPRNLTGQCRVIFIP